MRHDTAVGLRTFVTLGDSFTEGLEDDLGPDGREITQPAAEEMRCW